MYDLYNIIESLCNSRGITIGKLSKEIGVHRNTLPRLKTNPKKDLSLKTLEKISLYFNVPLEYFVDTSNPDPSNIPPEPEISDEQLMFALWGDEMDEFTPEDLEDIRELAYMKLLKKKEQKKKGVE